MKKLTLEQAKLLIAQHAEAAIDSWRCVNEQGFRKTFKNCDVRETKLALKLLVAICPEEEP